MLETRSFVVVGVNLLGNKRVGEQTNKGNNMKIFDVIWKVSVLSALVVFGCLIVSSQEDIYF